MSSRLFLNHNAADWLSQSALLVMYSPVHIFRKFSPSVLLPAAFYLHRKAEKRDPGNEIGKGGGHWERNDVIA